MRPPVSQSAIVVHGGVLDDFDRAAAKCQDALDDEDEGLYGLSVEAHEVDSLAEALQANELPHRKVRLATAARLEAEGWTLHPTFEAPHATLELPFPLDDKTWDALQAAFGSPTRNTNVT